MVLTQETLDPISIENNRILPGEVNLNLTLVLCTIQSKHKIRICLLFCSKNKAMAFSDFGLQSKSEYFPGTVLHKLTITIWSTVPGKYSDFDCRPKSENTIAFVLRAKQ